MEQVFVISLPQKFVMLKDLWPNDSRANNLINKIECITNSKIAYLFSTVFLKGCNMRTYRGVTYSSTTLA